MLLVAKQTSVAGLEPTRAGKHARAGKHVPDDQGQASAVGGSNLLQDALDDVGRQDPELSNE